ncbi:MAG: hypothetical protein AAFY60_21095, partial [Myxococcota bacterium]
MRNIWAIYGVFAVVVLVVLGLAPRPEAAAPEVDLDTLLPPDVATGPASGVDSAVPGVPAVKSAGGRQLPENIQPFTPPGDGKLTDAHVEMFTRVARAARKTAAGRVGDVTMQWAEARAAESLGFDPKGYRWAQARIHLALIHNERREQIQMTLATRERLLSEIERMREEASSEAQRAIIDDELDAMLGTLQASLPPESESERHNRLLVQGHLDALRTAMGLGSEQLGPRLEVIEEGNGPDDAAIELDESGAGIQLEDNPADTPADDEEILIPFSGTVGEENLVVEDEIKASNRASPLESESKPDSGPKPEPESESDSQLVPKEETSAADE